MATVRAGAAYLESGAQAAFAKESPQRSDAQKFTAVIVIMVLNLARKRLLQRTSSVLIQALSPPSRSLFFIL